MQLGCCRCSIRSTCPALCRLPERWRAPQRWKALPLRRCCCSGPHCWQQIPGHAALMLLAVAAGPTANAAARKCILSARHGPTHSGTSGVCSAHLAHHCAVLGRNSWPHSHTCEVLPAAPGTLQRKDGGQCCCGPAGLLQCHHWGMPLPAAHAWGRPAVEAPWARPAAARLSDCCCSTLPHSSLQDRRGMALHHSGLRCARQSCTATLARRRQHQQPVNAGKELLNWHAAILLLWHNPSFSAGCLTSPRGLLVCWCMHHGRRLLQRLLQTQPCRT